MKRRHILLIVFLFAAFNLSASNLSTLKQISAMLNPVECSVTDIATAAEGASSIAKKTMEISDQLNTLKAQAESYSNNGRTRVFEKLQMLQTAQQLLKNAKSQTISVSKLLSSTRKFSPLINALKEPAKKLAAKKSAEYCTKLLGLCNAETRSQINTATQILKILKASR